MEKIQNWTKAIFIAGILWIVVALSWFITYHDPSQLILYLALGVGILCFGGLVEWILRIRQYHRDLSKRVDDQAIWITGFENERANEKK